MAVVDWVKFGRVWWKWARWGGFRRLPNETPTSRGEFGDPSVGGDTRDRSFIVAWKQDNPRSRAILVCNVPRPRRTDDQIEILPLRGFLDQLWSGNL